MFKTNPASPPRLIKASKLAGAKNLAKVANSAKKMMMESIVVTANKIVKYILL